jgi:flavin reductase (DIM6/NTAB) family NADH-FMN oxidoreductase RutF/DNA-binding GntR family transcriptional regulator
VNSPTRTARPEEAVVEQQVFRDVIGRFASGVTVITTTVDGVRFGTTASAVTSLSLEPPMVLVCLNRSSDTQAAVLKAGTFCVNILAEGQEELAYQFAKKGDKFANVLCDEGLNGVPVLRDTLAHLECVVRETVTGGTHTVFMGRVAVAKGREGTPLTYYRGRFGRLESAREEAAYQAVRSWVLTRRVPLNQPLELTKLAEDLELETPHVAYALLKLASEHLVTRTTDGQYVATPVTVELADDLFLARCAIELGVADSAVGKTSPEDLAALEDYATKLAAIIAQDAPNLSEFLDASHGYHVSFVGLAKSPQLIEMYSRLGISSLWRRAIAEHDWWNKFDIAHHAELTEACRDRDVERARQLIIGHTNQVKKLVRELIDRAGGAL